jgi:RNA-directed DNA polymerase
MHSPSATSPTGGAEARRVVTQPALHDDLMERIVDRANMRRAWKRVKANKGAPGSDGMTLEDFLPSLVRTGPASAKTCLMGPINPSRCVG